MKLTPWFSSTTPPVRPGVYQVSVFGPPSDDRFAIYSYWDGNQWCRWQLTVADSAANLRKSFNGPPGFWRGVTEDAWK